MSTTNHTLLSALGIDELEPAEQEALLLDLNDLIFKGTVVSLLERMDADTRALFDDLLKTDPDEEQVLAFFQERVPDADQAVADTVKELTDDILAVTGESQD